jgi:hypothetical protein
MKKALPTLDVPTMFIFWIIGLFLYPSKYANAFLTSYAPTIQTSWLTWLVARAAWFLLWFVGYRLSAILASWIALSINKTRNPFFVMPLQEGTNGKYYRRYKIYTFMMVFFIPLHIFLSFYGFGLSWWGEKGVLNQLAPFIYLASLYMTYYISGRAAGILEQIEAYMEIEAEKNIRVVRSAVHTGVIILSVLITVAIMTLIYKAYINPLVMGIIVLAIPAMVFAWLLTKMFLNTFGSLFRPKHTKLEDLRTAIDVTYLLDELFLLLFMFNPSGSASKWVILFGLICLTVLAVRWDRQYKVGGLIRFLGLGLPIGIVTLSITLFPKPLYEPVSAWYLFQAEVFMTAFAPTMWLQTALLTRRSGFGNIWVLLKVIWKAKRVALIMIAILLQFTFMASNNFWPSNMQLQYAVPLLAILTNAFLIFRPPLAIVLTGSKSWELMDDVSKTLFPHRTIALLDEQSFIGAEFFLMQVDNLRAMKQFEWKELVTTLVDIATIVIVDTRISGESLKYETGLMLGNERIHKAIFVVGFHGESPALEANRDSIGASQLLTVTEEELSGVLHWFLRTGKIQKTPALEGIILYQ